jgi:hypothetical protein
MFKLFIASLFLLVASLPALAKPADVYPVSCNQLWTAVKDTLDTPHNYSILSENDLSQRAAFVVVGKLVQYTDTVSLAPSGTGCAMKATLLEVGSDNADWRQFHHRLAQALAKLQAAKPKPDEPAPAQP